MYILSTLACVQIHIRSLQGTISFIFSRFNILSNYLSSLSKSSKFVNKYKIKEAVKNINNELEDAQREFDKLFKVDKEYE